MTTRYIVYAWDGQMTYISAYTQSDAYQQAYEWAQDHQGIMSFEED